MPTAPTIVREIRIAASPETVFAFFTDPAKLASWKGRAATVEPAAGGRVWIDFNGTDVMEGEFVELDPPHRIVFTWGWRGEGHPIPPGSTRVEVTFVPDGDGTIVRLEHSGIPADAVPQHALGWDHYLPRLLIVAEGGDPGPDEHPM